MELNLRPAVGKTRKLSQLWKCSKRLLKKSHFGCSITCLNWISPDKSTWLAPLLPIHKLLRTNTSGDKETEESQITRTSKWNPLFYFQESRSKSTKTCSTDWSRVSFRIFLELIEVKISQFLRKCKVSSVCRLRHPGQIKTLQPRCRNCLIFLSCFQDTVKQKVMVWRAASREHASLSCMSAFKLRTFILSPH